MAQIGNPINGTSDDNTTNDTTSQDTTETSSGTDDDRKRRRGARRSVGELQEQDSLIDDTTNTGNTSSQSNTPSSGGAAAAPDAGTGQTETSETKEAQQQDTSSFEQGLENGPGASGVSQQAQSFEEDVSDQYGVSRENVRITEGDNNMLTAEFSEAGGRETVQRALSRPGTRNRAMAVGEVQRRRGDFLSDDTREQRQGAEDAVREQHDRELSVTEAQRQRATTPDPENVENRAEAARGELEAGQDAQIQQAVQEAEREAETGSFTLSLGGHDFTLEGQARDVEPVMQEDGSISFETQERSSISEDFDFSFGLGGEEDEVENVLRNTNEFFVDKATGVGEHTTAETDGVQVGTTKGVFSESLIAEGLDAAGYDEEADALESTGREFVGKSVQGVASLPAIATGVPLAAMEGAETISTGTKRTLQGEGGDYLDEVADATGGMLGGASSKAAANPAGTVGLVAGSLVGTAGAFRAARAVGPRTSLATRYAIQPGEEVLGRGGFAATKKLRGESTAQRFFPNKEPLIFSEEAAIRGGKRGLGRLKQAANADSLQAFRRSERAQGDLTGMFKRSETERENEVEFDDTGPLAEVEDAAEQQRDQFRYQTNRRLEQRQELEPDPEPPDPQTVSRRNFDTVTQSDYSTVTGGPDTGRSGPRARQQAAQRAEVTDTSSFDLSPREKQLAAGLETPEADLRAWAAKMEAEERAQAVQEPQVRLDDEFSGTAAKETSLSGFDATFAQDAALDDTLALDTEFGQFGDTESLLGTDTEVGVDTETGVDVLSETETGIGTDLTLESEAEPAFDFETDQEQDFGFETDVEQEYDFETEQEFRFEQEQEFETELGLDEKKNGGKKPEDDFGFAIDRIEFDVLSAEDVVLGDPNQ